MNANDVILHLIDLVIAEKEKNFMLQQHRQQEVEQMQEKSVNKD